MAAPRQRIACLMIHGTDWGADRGPADRLEALAEACMRWSPRIAIRPGEAVFLEIGGSRNLFSEESLAQKLKALSQRFGYASARIGIAEAAGKALAFARYDCAKSEMLPIEALADFLSPFSRLDEKAQGLFHKMLHAFHALGVFKLGQFIAIPASEIAPRFGKQACEAHARVLGLSEAAWEGFHPAEKITEEIEAQCHDLEALLFVLKTPLDRAMARLRGRGGRVSRFTIGLECECWSVLEKNERKTEIELSLPQGSAVAVLPILRERLARELEKEPLGSPVCNVRVEILEAAPGQSAQRDFFCGKEEEQEALESLILRLSERIGKGRVFSAVSVSRHLPEGAYARDLSVSLVKPAQDISFPLRPLRLLKEPELLKRQGQVLMQEEGRRWQALFWQGPERISGEWWQATEGFGRDYYRVVTKQGEELWIFSDLKKGGALYLHGYFD